MRLPTRKSEKDRLLEEEDYVMTQAAYDKLTRDFARLNHDRLAAAEEVARTAAMGDLSENAAYQYAKQHLRSMLSRMTRIEDRLARAVIIHKPADGGGVVCLGSVVTVLQGEKTLKWTIVGALEASPTHGRISHKSPVGNALLGHGVGDEVLVHTGATATMYRIVHIA